MIKIEISEITKKQKSLENHHVFSVVQNIDDLRVFMSWHVFAVWDFMCLVKRLQRDLTSVESLWVPPDSPLAARLMNEIVLGEESDEAPDGSYISHFELYLLAMKEIGADTRLIENFIDLIRKNYVRAGKSRHKKWPLAPYVRFACAKQWDKIAQIIYSDTNMLKTYAIYHIIQNFNYDHNWILSFIPYTPYLST